MDFAKVSICKSSDLAKVRARVYPRDTVAVRARVRTGVRVRVRARVRVRVRARVRVIYGRKPSYSCVHFVSTLSLKTSTDEELQICEITLSR